MRDRSPVSLVVLAGALSSGCFSSSSAPPVPEGQQDAETQTVVDATAAQEAAAPVQDATVAIEAGPEAGLPEAAPEAAVEAGPAPVTVTIVNHLGPEPGVYIVFQDVNGSVVDTATTNALGQVTQLLGSATQVTALTGATPSVQVGVSEAVRHGVANDDAEADAGQEIVPSPSYVNLVTVQGVEPGDNLSLFDPSDTTYSNASVNVASVPEGGPAATQSYVVSAGGCPPNSETTTTLPLDVGLSPDCESNGVFPVLVFAQGGADASDAILGYTWQNGNTIPLDGGTANVVMTGPWETATTTQTITAENVPTTGYSYAIYSELANNVATPSSEGFVETGSPTQSVTFAGHPGFATAVQNEVGKTLSADGLYGATAIATRGPFDGDSGVTVDLSTTLPPINWVVQDAGLSTSDAAVPPSGQPSAAWGTDAGSLASLSGVVVQFSWYDSYEDNGGQLQGTWTIVAPPTATGVTAPALPPQLAAWGLGPDAFTNNVPIVVAVESSLLPTYAAFRGQFVTLPVTAAFLNFSGGPLIPALPTAGTVKVTAVTSAGE